MTRHDPSRRQFLGHLAAGAVLAGTGLGLSGCDDDDVVIRFRHGVASGDPLADRVILWTRATPAEAGDYDIDWEIARDAEFKQLAGHGRVRTGPSQDYTVKVDASGLQPGTSYFFRFKHGDRVSPVGQTRTLGVGALAQARFAVMTCSNYPAGYFHVYAEAAKRDDLDAVIHLGDYIYEYEAGGYASEDAEALGRVVEPSHELTTLSDYRRRYAQYHGDPDLQALHAKVPFICVWDDHEIANDSYQDGAENHGADEGAYSERRAAAVQAFHEWLPTRLPDPANPLKIYRSFDFGDLLSLHMLDTRNIGRDRQLDYADYIDPTTGAFNAVAFEADMADPNRQLLGAEQTAWLQGQMAASHATWQVLGQQVLMGKMYLPSPLLTPSPQAPTVSFAEYGSLAVAFGTYQAIAAQLTAAGQPLTPENLLAAGLTAEQLATVNDPTAQAIIQAPSIPYNLDAWDGYAVARETVLATVQALDKNLVVLAGDTHNAWASDLKTLAGTQVGVEFATTSVSSPGLEEYLPDIAPAELTAGVQQLIPDLKYANTYQRGYLLVTVTATEARGDWYFVDTVKSKTYSFGLQQSLRTLPGAGHRRIESV
ncbi:MAG: alkaline phosphatase D family protein [Pseudomonadota bacterium]